MPKTNIKITSDPPAAPTGDQAQSEREVLSRQCTSSAKQSGQISDDLYDRTFEAYRAAAHTREPRQLDNPELWKRVQECADSVKDYPEWMKGSPVNERAAPTGEPQPSSLRRALNANRLQEEWDALEARITELEIENRRLREDK